jgi:hypothetical protein
MLKFVRKEGEIKKAGDRRRGNSAIARGCNSTSRLFSDRYRFVGGAQNRTFKGTAPEKLYRLYGRWPKEIYSKTIQPRETHSNRTKVAAVKPPRKPKKGP